MFFFFLYIYLILTRNYELWSFNKIEDDDEAKN